MYPAIATIEALKERGEFEFLFVGGKKGIEMNIVPRYGIAMRSIWISGFQRYFTWRNILFPVKLLLSLIQSWLIVRRFNPAVAVGTGGYVTGPVLYVASKMGIPVLIQEQDVFPGVTTRLLKKQARRICLAFEGAKKYFEDCADKILVTGNPVRSEIRAASRAEAKVKWNLDPDQPVVFVFGGSQGSRAINKALLQILPKLMTETEVQILWQAGEREYQTVIDGDLDERRVKVFPYIDEMEVAYSAADVIVCRAGAITLAELAMVRKPVILVPYPLAAGKHQEHNARLMEEEGAALMLLEQPGWEEKLYASLTGLLADSSRIVGMAAAWQRLAKPDAAGRVAEEVVRLMQESGG